MTMTKGERAELRAAVRLQFKVLRSEVVQRQSEVRAELEEEIDADFAKHKKVEEDIKFLVNEVILEANRKVNDILYQHELQVKTGSETQFVALRTPIQFAEPNRRRKSTRVGLNLDTKVREAEAILDRQEADMLRRLTLDALESEEARAFFDAIPTVSALVPATRLAELEAAMGE